MNVYDDAKVCKKGVAMPKSKKSKKPSKKQKKALIRAEEEYGILAAAAEESEILFSEKGYATAFDVRNALLRRFGNPYVEKKHIRKALDAWLAELEASLVAGEELTLQLAVARADELIASLAASGPAPPLAPRVAAAERAVHHTSAWEASAAHAQRTVRLVAQLATEGRVRQLRTLVVAEPDCVQVCAAAGHALAHAAARGGHTETLRFLAAAHPPLMEMRSYGGQLPAHDAAAAGRAETLAAALELAEAPVDGARRSIVHHAAASGDLATLKVALGSAGSSVQRACTAASRAAMRPLHEVAAHGTSEMVALLVRAAGGDGGVQMLDVQGRTPAHIAAAHGNSDALVLLVTNPRICLINAEERDAGANPSPATLAACGGGTPMHMAAAGGHSDAVRALAAVERRCVLARRPRDGAQPMHVAARAGHANVVAFLAKKAPAAALSADACGRFPLHLAAAGGHPKVVRTLLKSMRDSKARRKTMRQPDAAGRTALHHAALASDAVVVRLLEAYRSCVDSDGVKAYAGLASSDGAVALALACGSNRVSAVSALIAIDPASLRSADCDGRLAVHRAAASGCAAAIRLVGEADRSCFHAVDRGGRTPAHVAASAGHVEALRALIEVDWTCCSSDKRDAAGGSPAELAIAAGHTAAAAMIERAAAVAATAEEKTGVEVEII